MRLPTIGNVDVSTIGFMSRSSALVQFVLDESGQDLLEFALVAAMLSLCAVASLKGLSNDVLILWNGLYAGLSSVL